MAIIYKSDVSRLVGRVRQSGIPAPGAPRINAVASLAPLAAMASGQGLESLALANELQELLRLTTATAASRLVAACTAATLRAGDAGVRREVLRRGCAASIARRV